MKKTFFSGDGGCGGGGGGGGGKEGEVNIMYKCFKWHVYSSRRTTLSTYSEIHANIEDMAETNSIYDHFIIWPSSVSLIINLPKQVFQMALLLLKENTCAKLF